MRYDVSAEDLRPVLSLRVEDDVGAPSPSASPSASASVSWGLFDPHAFRKVFEQRKLSWDWLHLQRTTTAEDEASAWKVEPRATAMAALQHQVDPEAEGVLLEATSGAFDAVFDWLGLFLSLRPGKGEGAWNKEWAVTQVVQVMVNMEFCRRRNHGAYVEILVEVLGSLRQSEAASKLCFGETMGNLQETVREEGNSSLFAKSYFFLRVFPAMAKNLGPLLLEDSLLELLFLLSRRPVTQSEEISKIAHDCIGLVFSHAPLPPKRPGWMWMSGNHHGEEEDGFGRLYVSESLRLYPTSTPYNQFALAVLSMAKRQEFGTGTALYCARGMASRAATLESKGDHIHASALRKLLFGLVNVVPLAAVADLVVEYEAIIAAAAEVGHSSGGGLEGKRKVRSTLLQEFAAVLDANGDYFRKPDLAAWLQRMMSPGDPSHHGHRSML
ncbi:hypothetical protein HOP50_09g53990 [Chloropicon primus]|nr:hypothetical protein HOP50_09g53990 [Chloropicon primus]